ncbi:MAG: nuclease-related domain-containing protein [Lysinibacillus sp.]
MLILERTKSHKLLMLESIVRRLPKSSSNYPNFHDMYRKAKAGYAGELHVDWLWQEMHFPFPNFLFHNLELVNEAGHSHQIDSLYLTPYFACVLEIKNIAGRVSFNDTTRQFIRVTPDGRVDGLLNPVDQVLRHERFIRKLFKQNNINLPIKSLVVISYPSTIISDTSSNCHIIHREGLPQIIEQFLKQYQEEVSPNHQLFELAKTIQSLNRPKKWIPEISIDSLKTGVLCPSCFFNERMFFLKGDWFCKVCGMCDNAAFSLALQDYRRLKNEFITNQILYRIWCTHS